MTNACADENWCLTLNKCSRRYLKSSKIRFLKVSKVFKLTFWRRKKIAKRAIHLTFRGCRQRQRDGLDPKVRERPPRDKLQYGDSLAKWVNSLRKLDLSTITQVISQTMLAGEFPTKLVPVRKAKLLAESEDHKAVRVALPWFHRVWLWTRK